MITKTYLLINCCSDCQILSHFPKPSISKIFHVSVSFVNIIAKSRTKSFQFMRKQRWVIMISPKPQNLMRAEYCCHVTYVFVKNDII